MLKNHWLQTGLELWTNDFDFVIASSEEEAIEIAIATMGYGYDDLEECEWYTMPEDSIFTLRYEDSPVEKEPVAYFIEKYGLGYLASSEL